jgi:hypothetical protein
MIAVRLAVLGALAVASFGQTTPKDVDGWDKIKWGMTMAEVRAAYHIDAKPESKDDWMLLQLNPVKMSGVQMGVQAGARQDNAKISSVRLWSHFGLSDSPPGAGAQDFDTLRTMLIQKYGQPANEETKRGENFRLIKTVSWIFPSTRILMTLEQSSSIPNLGNIDIDYTANR